MSTDIYVCGERFVYDGYHKPMKVPGIDQQYSLFGWLSDVRNYSGVPVFPRRYIHLPDDLTADTKHRMEDLSSITAFTVAEFLAFDWNQPLEDLRCTVQVAANIYDGGGTAKPGEGRMTTYRKEFDLFYKWIADIRSRGVTRFIVGYSY